MNLSTELTKQVMAHLDEVRKYLGNLPADERQEILQSIESHIYDALENRRNGDPTPALLDAVIAEMDPPESYGELPAVPKKKNYTSFYALGVVAVTTITLLYFFLVQDKQSISQPIKTYSTVTEGVGWDDIHFGMLRSEVIKKLGVPTYNRGRPVVWENPKRACFFTRGLLTTVGFYSDYTGQTSSGIRIGSTRQEVLEAYGDPDNRQNESVHNDSPNFIYNWYDKGIGIVLKNDKAVYRISVFDQQLRKDIVRTTYSINPIGRWISIDYVADIEQFDPQLKTWTNDLYLKDLSFLPDGKTDRSFWTWKNGALFHSGDQTQAELYLRKIKGKEYLFLEWISGDVIHRGQPPKYYVLKRATPETHSLKITADVLNQLQKDRTEAGVKMFHVDVIRKQWDRVKEQPLTSQAKFGSDPILAVLAEEVLICESELREAKEEGNNQKIKLTQASLEKSERKLRAALNAIERKIQTECVLTKAKFEALDKELQRLVAELNQTKTAPATNNLAITPTIIATEEEMAAQQAKARDRMREDREIYSRDELRKIETLYQVANKKWRSEEGKDSLKELISKYYVLKRGEDNETALSDSIVPGVGCGAFRIGASRNELTESLGEPDSDSEENLLKWSKERHIHCLSDANQKAYELRFEPGFIGRTAQGMQIGVSLLGHIRATYGEPTRTEKLGIGYQLVWADQGISIKTGRGFKVYQISIFEKVPLESIHHAEELIPIRFKLGTSSLKKGDTILIKQVLSTSPHLKIGDTVTVKGRFKLSSQPTATLLLTTTATQRDGHSNTIKEQRITASRGSGEFDLTFTIPHQGCSHLAFYDTAVGQPLGGLYFGTKEQVEALNKNADTQKGKTMNRSLKLTAAAILAVTNLIAGEAREEFHLQEAIDNASAGDTIVIPAGTYTQSVIIRKKITLVGNGAILKVESNQPAIQIDTSKPVVLKDLEIQYQTETKPQQGEFPYAVYTSGGDLLIENCTIKETGRSGTVPCAVSAADRSVLHIKNSRFDGFNYTIQFGNESEGSVENCLIKNPGHCGITIGNGSSARLNRNVVTGSRYHGIRCTGGEIFADSNLVIANKNRGFYIGNKSATGTLSNNLIVDNATGINVFAYSKLDILNNVILRSSYAGLALIDTAKLDIENNIIADNERGIVGFSSNKGKEPSVRLRGENIAFGNTTQTEGIKLPSELIGLDPQFEDPDSGLFSTGTSDAKCTGLSSPTEMQMLWNKWKKATTRRKWPSDHCASCVEDVS